MGKPYFLYGGVKIRISGRNVERFFNIAAQRELRICDIRQETGGAATCWTCIEDLKKMKPLRRKTDVRIRILERYGLPFSVAESKGRKLMITGFLAFFFLLYIWSFFIWDITIEGNHKFSDQTLLAFMESIPVTNGMRKSDISCELLETELRNHFQEITWVSAEIRGTRLILAVRENEALLSVTEEEFSPCDLVAAKDGVVVKNVIRSGIGQVKPGDPVEAGQLLVTGSLPIYDDAEVLVKRNRVRADGEIFAETKENINIQIPLLKREVIRTGRKRTGYLFGVMEQVFYALLPDLSQSQWEYVTDQTQWKLFENYYLPIYFGRIDAYEVSSYEKIRTKKEADEIVGIRLAEYMENLMEKGVQILGCDGRIEQDESGWHYEGTLILLENIAVETAIPENQEENQTVNECN